MIRRWKGLCARRSSCLLFQMFGVETSSFLPNEQSNGRDLARQGETSHRHFPSFGKQRGVEILKGFDNYPRIKPTTSRPAPTTLRKRMIAETSKGVSGEQVM